MILTVSDTGKDGLLVCGPRGTERYLRATRHFLYRPQFALEARDIAPASALDDKEPSTAVCYSDSEISIHGIALAPMKAGVKRKLDGSAAISDLPSSPPSSVSCASETKSEDAVCYVVETAEQRGKFLVEKARAFGVPPGKLFGQLHQGKDVELPDGRVVKSSDCVSPSLPGSGCAVIACPSIAFVDQLVSAAGFARYQKKIEGQDSQPELQLQVIYHLADQQVLGHPKYIAWAQRFGSDVDHVLLNHEGCAQKTVFRASANLQAQLQTVFPNAFPKSDYEERDAEIAFSRTIQHEIAGAGSKCKPVIPAESMLSYTITPVMRRGFDASRCFQRLDHQTIEESTRAIRGSLASAEKDNTTTLEPPKVHGRITFLGTGCAIPSKYRNVTGMYLEIEQPSTGESPSWVGMMLDCGEGSYGQLARYANGDAARLRALVNQLKCIWISHNHADHHLGVVRMLSERSREQEQLLVLGPAPVQYWLQEYAQVDPTVAGKYTFVDNAGFNEQDERFEDLVAVTKPTRGWLRETLQITQLQCVPVKHAHLSYAAVVTFQDSMKIAFSGDCRPSDEFANAAHGAFLMIHEATFEDNMTQEAKQKAHSTTSEAIRVGRAAGAQHVVLTHFSQRYPKMPVLDGAETVTDGHNPDVLTAIDMLSLRFSELHQPQLMDICTQLMTKDDKDSDEAQDQE